MVIDGSRGPTPPPDDDDDDEREQDEAAAQHDPNKRPDAPAPPLPPEEGITDRGADRPPLKFLKVMQVDGIRIETAPDGVRLVVESRGNSQTAPDVEVIVRTEAKHLDALLGLLKSADWKAKDTVVYSVRFPRPDQTQLELAL